jgi:hypothetical protein
VCSAFRRNEEFFKTQFNPPFLSFSHRATTKDLRKICLVNLQFLLLVKLAIIMSHMIIVIVRNPVFERFQSSMEMLKNFLGGKPTSTVIS